MPEVCVKHKYYEKDNCSVCAGHALQMELDLEDTTLETDEDQDGNPTDQ